MNVEDEIERIKDVLTKMVGTLAEFPKMVERKNIIQELVDMGAYGIARQYVAFLEERADENRERIGKEEKEKRERHFIELELREELQRELLNTVMDKPKRVKPEKKKPEKKESDKTTTQ